MREPAPNPAALLASFARVASGVEVVVRHGGGSALMGAQVGDGRLDLAFVSLHEPPPRRRAHHALGAADPARVQRRPSPGARDRVELGELTASASPIFRRSGARASSTIARSPPPAITRTIAYEINDTSTLLEFARHGLAVTMLPASIAGRTPGIVLVPIGGMHRGSASASPCRPSGD